MNPHKIHGLTPGVHVSSPHAQRDDLLLSVRERETYGFANYVTPVLELMGVAELEHGPRNNRVRLAAR